MDYRISQYSIMGCGQRLDSSGSPLQEDCIYPAIGEESDTDRLFIVCDGMGGQGAGDVAASAVCRAIGKAIGHKQIDEPFGVDDLRQAIGAAYAALDRIDTAGREKMGTTLALLKLYDDGYYTTHIGDSRVYHIRPGLTADDTKIIFCTRDHSLVNHLVDRGEMTPYEASTSPKRHVITRAMQPKMTHKSSADVHSDTDIHPGDYFMLCSDGMLENLSDSNIRAIFSFEGGNDHNKVGLLAKVASNSVDNYSAIIVHINDVIENMAIDPITKPIHIPKTDDMQSLAQTRATVARKTREFVRKHKDRGDAAALFLKFLIAVMALISIIMIIYYLFMHRDETLQTAGTAVDSAVESSSPGVHDAETYGYEITEEDKKNFETPITSTATEDDLFEEIIEEDEPVTTPTEEPEAQTAPEPSQAPATTPAPPATNGPNEPILQE